MNESYVTFLKTNEEFGGLSNMCGDYFIMINSVRILSSEHLYQSLKFSENPEIQKQILSKPSPIVAKMVSRKKDHKELIRSDWNEIQLEVMEFCLKTKLIWNWVKFGNLLRLTEGKTIYEISSKKDKYWGVIRCDDGFVGENNLGKLLMKLRDEFMSDSNEHLRLVTPPAHINLKFLGENIQITDRRNHLQQAGTRTTGLVNELKP